MSSGLQVRDVVVQIGDARLLDGVSLDVARGRIVAVVGPNGAGKTTLLDVVSGTMPLARGSVAIDGRTDGGVPRPGVGRVFQGSPLPETLTVAEVAALVSGGRRHAAALLDRFGLWPHATSFVAELSTGMRRILDLAVATVGQPDVLLLDEPASGLAQSEIDHLAEILLRWRDATGAAVILVEHDASLVRAVADEVVVLEQGGVASRGTIREMLRSARSRRLPRLRSPQEEHFQEALARISQDAAPASPPMRRTLSTWTLLRLGLQQFSLGLATVLVLSVLNRVMKVEYGISLGLVAAVLAGINLAAPLAVPIGHRSDTRPLFGRRRGPYILGGTAVVALATLAAPHVATMLRDGITAGSILVTAALFLAMGVGIWGSATVFFALLADKVPAAERGNASSVVYLMLMGGILGGVALAAVVLGDEAEGLSGDLTTLFTLSAVIIMVLAVVAVWGQERREAPVPPAPVAERAPTSMWATLRQAARVRQARLFFAFLILVTLFMFLQEIVIEPFGGDVLGLNVRQTTAFKAMQTAGILVGMAVAGRWIADRWGHKRLAVAGLSGAAVMFGALALAAVTRSAPPIWFAITGTGLAIGLFQVANLSLIMGMVDRSRVALFIGAWTVAHAFAKGVANAGGGAVFEVARVVTGSEASGYAMVFAVQAVGLALCVPLLRGVDPERFSSQYQAVGPAGAAAGVAPVPAAITFPAEEPSAPVAAPNGAKKPVARKAARKAARKPAARKPAAKKPAAKRAKTTKAARPGRAR